jgi:hypothetical protein
LAQTNKHYCTYIEKKIIQDKRDLHYGY